MKEFHDYVRPADVEGSRAPSSDLPNVMNCHRVDAFETDYLKKHVAA